MKRLLVTLAVVLGASTVALKFAAVPYVWIFLLVGAASVIWVVTSRAARPKLIAVNLAAATLALAGIEAHFAGLFSGGGGELADSVEYDANLFRPHETLGYGPRPGVTVGARKVSGTQVSYQATYSIDSHGLRISPPDISPDAPCVLFFGGSFTFGVGVENHETMPWLAGVLSGYRPYNFGFNGYGPHQMLAALETGLAAERVADCPVEAVVYQAMSGHPMRAAGKSGWDAHGPRYRVGPDGEAVRAGHFDDPERPPEPLIALVRWRLANQLEKSRIVHRLFPEETTSVEEDLELFVAIVRASQEQVQETWPGTPFHLLVWDGQFPHGEISTIRESLRSDEVTIHFVTEILPPLPEGETYSFVDDEHPNALAHRILGEYVATEILGGERSGSPGPSGQR